VWAIVGAAIVMLHPAIWFTSAWWGQYESVFALLVLAAFVFAVEDHPLLGAIAMTAALMTKPQTLPLGLPFAAFYLARYDLRTIIRAGLTAVVAAIALWAPFLQAGGPQKYLEALAYYHDDRFGFISLRAWNLWWGVQLTTPVSGWIPDSDPFVGPLSYRDVGYALTGLLALIVAYRIWRRPNPTVFALGIASTALVSFAFLTTMHERYAYAALIFFALLPDRRLTLALSAAVGMQVTLNLLGSASAANFLHDRWPVTGLGAIIWSFAMCAFAVISVVLVLAEREGATSAVERSARLGASGGAAAGTGDSREAAHERDPIPVQVMR
jgi:Gpi18-like mannosyltransferase